MIPITDNNWALSVAVFLPLAGVAVMLFIPRAEEQLHKLVALVTSLATAGVGVYLLASFDYDRAGDLQFFVDKPWIDAPARPGKSPGAFAHSTVPSAHPYLLLNYQGKTRDVMTLAHELGHGVHQVLAAPQGALMADTPLTLAETASVFGEMLTFRALLKQETDPKRRRVLLAGKVEDMLNTVVRQIAFYEFERRVHAARRACEVRQRRQRHVHPERARAGLDADQPRAHLRLDRVRRDEVEKQELRADIGDNRA